MKKGVALAFLLACTLSLGAASAPCGWERLAGGAGFAPHEGVEEPGLETPSARYFRLGSGLQGGVMRRVVPKSPGAPSFLEKEYSDAWKASEDAKVFSSLRREGATPAVFGFELPMVSRDGAVLRFDRDVPGRDLHWLLTHSSLGREQKTALTSHYNQRVNQAVAFLLGRFRIVNTNVWSPGQFPYADGTYNELPVTTLTYQDPQTRDLLTVSFKPDNVIVHSDGAFCMTLVDPY